MLLQSFCAEGTRPSPSTSITTSEYFFAIASLLMGWFSASRRRAERFLIEARNNLELRVAERTVELTRTNEDLQNTQAELRRREAYLVGAQRLSHTGSFGWSVLSGEIYWSEETYKIFEHDRAAKPTLQWIIQQIHPDDRDRVQHTLDCASAVGADFDLESRLLMADGSVKYVHVLGRALKTSAENLEFVGAVTDVTAAKQAEEELTVSPGRTIEDPQPSSSPPRSGEGEGGSADLA